MEQNKCWDLLGFLRINWHNHSVYFRRGIKCLLYDVREKTVTGKLAKKNLK